MSQSFFVDVLKGLFDRAERTLKWPWLSTVIVFVTLVLMFLFWVFYQDFTKRTYVLSVATSGLEIEFTRSLSNRSWQFSEVQLCRRRQTRLNNAVDTGGPCDEELYTQHLVLNAEVDFEKGAVASIEHKLVGGDVLIKLTTTDADVRINRDVVSDRSFMMIGPEAFRDAGALAFTGKVTIGQVASTGEKRLVSRGSYEVLERNWLSDKGAVQVKSGQFFRGDEITLVDDAREEAVEVTGFMSPADGSIAVQLTAPMGKNAIRVDRMGSEFSMIKSDALDRVAVDPTFRAISWALAVLLALLKLADWLRPSNEKNEAPVESNDYQS